MDQFNNLCDCIIRTFQQQLEDVNGIVSASNQQIVTTHGHDDPTVTFGLPRLTREYGESVSGTGLLMMTMIVLFILTLLTIRNNNRDTSTNTPHNHTDDVTDPVKLRRRDDDHLD